LVKAYPMEVIFFMSLLK